MDHKYNFNGLSLDEMKAKLRDALAASEEPENDEYIDALEDAIVKLERAAPTGFIPDKKADFRELMARMPRERAPRRRTRRVLSAVFRYGVAAVLAITVALGGMMTAEASGLNVFGTLAQFARSARGPEKTGYIVEISYDGNTRRFTGMALSRKSGSETVQYFDEESAADYTVTVETVDVSDAVGNMTPVYFSLLVDGLLADQEPVEGPCTFTMHGGPGDCVISAVSNADVTLDFTVERVPAESEGE